MLDTFQRYVEAYKYLREKSKNSSEIQLLEVGSNGLGFGRYNDFSNVRQTNLDVNEPDKSEVTLRGDINFVTYDGGDFPFDNNSFDYTICIDTLEHVPADSREKFLLEICRVTKRGIALTYPTRGSEKYEKILAEIFKGKSAFLNEHEKYGLPSVELASDIIESKSDFKLEEISGNINLNIWIFFKLLSSVIYRIIKYNPKLARVAFQMYLYSLANLVNFGRCYSVNNIFENRENEI